MELVDRWFEVLAETGNKGEACRAIGVSKQFYIHRQNHNEPFRQRMAEALMVLPALVENKLYQGLMDGFPYETLDREGKIITLHKHSDKMMALALNRLCGWDKPPERFRTERKDVQLMDSNKKPIDLRDMIRLAEERRKGITIVSGDPTAVAQADDGFDGALDEHEERLQAAHKAVEESIDGE